MSGRARLTVCAALASVLAAFSLLPLTSDSGWFFQAVLLVCVQSAVGAGARRVPLARPLTVLVQAVVSLVVVTMIFASHQALGGILPGPQAVEHMNQVVQDGLTDVSNFAIPAPVTPGIKILLVGGVVLVGLAVDAIAVTYNSAAPAGLPLLALYSIAAGLADGGGASWLYFLVAGLGYLVLLLAEGRDRLSRWGRVFSSGPPSTGWAGPGGQGSRPVPIRGARSIGVLALGIALVAPLALPSLGSGLLDTSGHGGGNGIGGRGGGGAVNLVAALQDNLNQPDNHAVLTYRTNAADTSGMYLRIAALDKFDGKEWSPSNLPTETIPQVLPQPQGMAADVRYKAATTQVQVDDSYVQGLLPVPFPALSVSAPGDWKFQPEGRMIVGEHGQTASGVRYTVTSMEVQPTAAQLAAAGKATGRIAKQYTEVPDSLPPVVKQTALQVTRGATSDYQRAVDLQRYFTSGQFVYNTQAKAGTGVDAIARFLQTKEGFCVHFAFTMAAMARTLDIPARVAIGFTPGSLNPDGSMTVGLKDAHAWPELYFPGIGWTRFEPTPYRGTAPDYTQTPSTGSGDNQQDLTPHTAAPNPTASPTTAPTCAPENRAPAQGDCGQAAVTAGGGSGGSGLGGAAQAGLIVLLALLVLLVPATPALWRRRQRHRRLGGGRRLPEGPTLAAWRELLDTGWDFGVLPEESETPRRATARLVREGGLDAPAAEAAARVATAVEQTLYAPDPAPPQGLSADVEKVRAGLRASAGRRTRLRAALLPRSSARLLWALSARRRAVTARLSAGASRLVPPPLRRRPAGSTGSA
jgi:transglutaminase-like putative cysteine protease